MKKNLFEEGNDNNETGNFKINKKFEKRYNYNRKREETDKLKEKYGKEEYNNFEESSNSSLSEDENGKLMDNDLLMDIMTIIPKIKNKSEDLYNKKINFFKKKKNMENIQETKKDKKYTIKNMIVENLENELEEENEDEIEKKETNYEKEKRLKSDFKQVAFETEDNFEDDFLTKKKNSPFVLESEKEINNFIEKGNEKMTEEEKNLVKDFWGEKNKDKMTEDERFLRDYIVKKKWMDKEEQRKADEFKGFNNIDKEDEKDDEKVDKFEHKYNFRFEEEGGRDLQFYKRDIKNSLGRENTKRKDKRAKLKEKKTANLKKIEQELRMLKHSKREKIINHIIKLKKTSKNDSKEYENFLKEILVSEFDQNYDQIMEQIFNDDYYEQSDNEEKDIKNYLHNIESEFSVNKKKENKNLSQSKRAEIQKQKEEGMIPKPNLPLEMRHNLKKEELKTIEKSTNKLIWWYCDNCLNGIQPLNLRFDCLQCPDYSLCNSCFSLKEHEHKMKKFFIPDGCFPPSNEEILEIMGMMKSCTDCNKKINNVESYYSHKDKDIIVCTSCINYIRGDLRLRDFLQIKPEKKKINNIEVEGLLEEYEGLDFEDVIAGGIKTRYEYIEVEKDDFGLTDAELLFTDDKLLNQMISIKKLAPYKNDQITNVDRNRMRKMRAMVKKSAEKNQKKFRKEQDLLNREKELKNLAKKSKKYKKEYERFLENKDYLIEKIYKDYEGPKFEEKSKINKNIENDINQGLEDFEIEKEDKNDDDIDEDRLKSYNL